MTEILLLPLIVIISIFTGNFIADREAKKKRRKRINAILEKKTYQQDKIEFEIIDKSKQI